MYLLWILILCKLVVYDWAIWSVLDPFREKRTPWHHQRRLIVTWYKINGIGSWETILMSVSTDFILWASLALASTLLLISMRKESCLEFLLLSPSLPPCVNRARVPDHLFPVVILQPTLAPLSALSLRSRHGCPGCLAILSWLLGTASYISTLICHVSNQVPSSFTSHSSALFFLYLRQLTGSFK